MKRYQWVAVSVSFVLAVTLWFLVTLNRQTYTTSFTIPVKLTNFPNDLQLLSEFPTELEVLATGAGIKLFYQGLDPIKDTVAIDFEVFRDKGFFSASKNLRLISTTLKQGVEAVSASPDTISLSFAVKSNKKVPVRIDVEWDLPPSYRVPPKSVVYTDSVLVVGPTDSLALVKECKTVHTKLPYSIEPQVLYIPLDSLGAMQMLPNAIKFAYTPIPYTERLLRLPVIANGLPLDTQLHFDPDSIEVKLLVPLDKFETVKASGLSVEVDHASLNARSPYVVPRIMHIPQDAELVSFAPMKIHYMVVTRE